MGSLRGFINVERVESKCRPVCERTKDYKNVVIPRSDEDSEDQASRCMDCGTPFCHWGCPIGNYIPEWNDLVFSGQWKRAYELLVATNEMPEVTGRICPAPCEYACVLGINDDPVTIRENELAIIEHAFSKGWIKPAPPKTRTGKKVAVVGSGPAGMACSARLNKMGHLATVFERDDKIGGILRYGIPDFKLEKNILDRRIAIWRQEGIQYITGANIGVNYPSNKLLSEYDAVCLAGGSRVPRDVKIEGRELSGIHFAMDYLTQSNRRIAGDNIPEGQLIDAKDKKVVVIGGGDTGADCVGTANRQGASCVVQIELLPRPAEVKTTSSHLEGCSRQWSILTNKFVGENGKVKKLSCVRVHFSEKDERGRPIMAGIPNSEFEIEADLVILAVGFIHPEENGLLKDLDVEFDKFGNVKTSANYKTSAEKIFSAGDMRRGQSLVVWALYEGRQAAKAIDNYLMGAKK